MNNCSTISTQTNTSTSVSAMNQSAGNLLDALESLKQQQTFATKITSSLLNSAAVAASNSLLSSASSSNKSNNNNQAFKCTICGYKGAYH